MRRPTVSLPAAFAALLLCPLVFAASVVKVTTDKDTGVYDVGQTVTWTVNVTADKKPVSAGKVSYKIKLGGADEIGKGEVDIADGKATITGKRDDPGVLLLEARFKGADDPKEVTGLGGAAFGWEQIKASAPVPDDFDAFWAGKVKVLKAIPMNAQVTPVDIGNPKVEYFKITLDNINGTKIHGQLARPAGKTEGLPAMLQVQYAGVYKLDRNWVIQHALNGWLTFNIEAHDLPIDETPEFYKAQSEGALKDYPGIGNDDRETAYFLRMFLSCYRAVDYLTERPEWNKKTILVQGGSQGGYQALVTAGFHPAVTAYAANVPAGCDHTGRQAKRAPGWPNWAGRGNKDKEKMLATSRYFDAMNFATRIKVPGVIGMGLIDTVCPPEGVFATINQITAPKQVVIMPRSGHGGDSEPHNAYYGKMGAFFNEHKAK